MPRSAAAGLFPTGPPPTASTPVSPARLCPMPSASSPPSPAQRWHPLSGPSSSPSRCRPTAGWTPAPCPHPASVSSSTPIFTSSDQPRAGEQMTTVADTNGTEPSAPEEVVLQASGITKRYGAVVALSDASVTLRRGEVLGLVGDNGAGKSTLLKVLSG